jgi:hypothetical protein
MSNKFSLASAAAMAVLSLGSVGGSTGSPSVDGFKSSAVGISTVQSQPAKTTKTAPSDSKTNRLTTGLYTRRKAPVGKRLRQSVAQNRRVANKTRAVRGRKK